MVKRKVGTFNEGKVKPGVSVLTAVEAGCPAADPTPGWRPCGGVWLGLGCCGAGPAPAVVVVGWLL